jgi:hypothetical protein
MPQSGVGAVTTLEGPETTILRNIIFLIAEKSWIGTSFIRNFLSFEAKSSTSSPRQDKLPSKSFFIPPSGIAWTKFT